MAILLNGAGGTAADSVLRNLGLELGAFVSSMDAGTVNAAGVDQAAGFPVTTSVLGSLSPASTVVTRGANGSYDDTSKRITIASTAGLSVGDYLYLSHASITAGVYKIATIPVAGAVTLVNNVFSGGANKTSIAYQVAWRYLAVAGTTPVVSSAAGTQNHWKFQASNDLGTATQIQDSFFVRDAPAGAAFIAIDGTGYTGQQTAILTPSFDLLPAWVNRGAVSHIAFGNHSVSAANDFKWGDGSVTEKTLAVARSGGLSFSAGGGLKRGAFLLRSTSGATVQYSVDADITLDTSAPTLGLFVAGR